MSVYHGKKLKIIVSGKSHGEKISASIKGLKGFAFDEKEVEDMLLRRSPSGKAGATERIEKDEPHYAKGVKNGRITGDVKIGFFNTDVRSEDYKDLTGIPRPSHADIGRYFKDGEIDFTGGGEYSGRVTVAFCAVGAICKSVLEKYYGVKISAYPSSVGDKFIKSFNDPEKRGVSQAEIDDYVTTIKKSGDSVGGRIECVIKNCPKGLGGSLFDGLESKISSLCYAVPAVKGVEFGKGFTLCSLRGSEANDEMRYDKENLVFESDNDGGIYGGISAGEITFAVAVKPTPSIAKMQNSVNLLTGENSAISVYGRHDACVALRAAPLIEAAAAIAISDEVLYENDRRIEK